VNNSYYTRVEDYYIKKKQSLKTKFFVRHSEFENFLLCERILINVTQPVKTKRQANFKDFKGFGAEQKKSCIQLVRV
jgi:hypothetical protein